ncbi:MAG: hypothetical protein V3U24_10715 [Candidatus Neomarinimicrobiota bacterium]
MRITCRSCGNHRRFLIPLWVRCTFKFREDGTITILHVKQLESLEEKLAGQGKTSFNLTCQECGDEAEIVFNQYEAMDEEKRQRQALEGL